MACPVTVNVYDMFWTNEYTFNLGLGVYHTGVVVYGVEYAYGGHQDPEPGVFEIEPGDVDTLGVQFKFKQTLTIGTTDFTELEVVQIIQELGNSFLGNQYHLLRKNCNHFTDALLKELTGARLPPWINRLASVSSSIPFIERALPKEWLRPGVVDESASGGEQQAYAAGGGLPAVAAAAGRLAQPPDGGRTGRSGAATQPADTPCRPS